MNYKHNKKAS